MLDRKETALKVAEFLLKIKAVKLAPDQPFTWASGWKSPIYCDNRISLSHPMIRTYIRQRLAELIAEEFGTVDLIAGVATAGIPQGVLVAEELELPFAYVRSSAKDHGMGNLIEGEVQKGQRVVVVEDLISTGSSSLKAVKALRDANCEVAGMVSIFTYGFKQAEDSFKKADCKAISLSNYSVLIEHALESGYVSEAQLDALKQWKDAPDKWGV